MNDKKDVYIMLNGKSKSEIGVKSKWADYAIDAYIQKKLTKESLIKVLKAVTM